MAAESSSSTTVVSPGTAGSHDDDVNMYEKMFESRYTDDDDEYMKTASTPLASPPCVTGWYTRKKHDWGRHGGRSDNRDNRDNRNWREGHGGGHGHQQNWNRGDRSHHHGYQGHGGYQDRQGHHGGDYRNPQQRYRE